MFHSYSKCSHQGSRRTEEQTPYCFIILLNDRQATQIWHCMLAHAVSVWTCELKKKSYRNFHRPPACTIQSRYHFISTWQQHSRKKPNGHHSLLEWTCVHCCLSWESRDSGAVRAGSASLSRWLSGPFKMSGALPRPPADHRTPVEEPDWAGNLSPRHAAVLSTPLIQSLPCHGGTGRALIQFTQQQKEKKPQTHSSLPAELCQLLDVTLSEKDEGNYQGNYLFFIMHLGSPPTNQPIPPGSSTFHIPRQMQRPC